MEYRVYDDRIKIYDIHTISKKDFGDVIDLISKENPEHPVIVNRSRSSMYFEMIVHKFLYNIGFKQSHTKDCDLNWPIKTIEIIGYYIIGCLTWLFVS